MYAADKYWIKTGVAAVMAGKNKRYGFVVLMFLSMPFLACAEESLVVRPQTGYGYSASKVFGDNDRVHHAGVRILLGAGGTKRYGLEMSRFNFASGDSFASLGIVLEQRLWGWFNMSIGTVGYFGYGAVSENVAGLMTNLGWESNSKDALKPFITYRNDLIFLDGIDVVHSLSAGLAIYFYR